MSLASFNLAQLKIMWEYYTLEELKTARRNTQENLINIQKYKYSSQTKKQALELIPLHKEAVSYLTELIHFREKCKV
jgi:hypothetical protein